MHFLPEGAEIRFIDHHSGMLEYASDLSDVLAICANIKGFYDALVMLRPVAFRADLLRAALLWQHGGLWMDHKMVLVEPLASLIDLTGDSAVMPLDQFNGCRNKKYRQAWSSFQFG